ncbi:hypothetical protein EPO56_00060 [Patescibacteria group bacterium]|nr:MAG: hypothetical protein EPO56_00060 [Patescibacteria group bacterium]
MLRILAPLLFLGMVFVAPWWMSVLFAILLLVMGNNGFIVVIGGIIIDLTFGTPIHSLGGFQYLYTTLFILLSIIAWYLKRTLSE